VASYTNMVISDLQTLAAIVALADHNKPANLHEKFLVESRIPDNLMRGPF
jgi:hypothetical protein